MGHMNFDNIMKVSKKKALRYIPKIIKPSDPTWKQCQHGKQTKLSFKEKEYSTSKPLELVHTDLCGSTRTKSMQGKYYFMFLLVWYLGQTLVQILLRTNKTPNGH